MRPAIVTVLAVIGLPLAAAAQQDARGSADHPLFSRMPDHYISRYVQVEFGSHTFRVSGKPVTVEGKVTSINYRTRKEAPRPGGLAIRRNYENAAREAGAEILPSPAGYVYARARRADGDVWLEVRASDSSSSNLYTLTIVEVAPMVQVITADAMFAAIDRSGMVAVNVLFDTGSAAIQPASMPLIDQIAAMLTAHPDLRLAVEGHTDNVGDEAANQALSEARAAAVAAAVVARGIAADRLTSAGFGESRPVADNATEDGRQQNRRVELRRR
ncbi:MAG: OmpA family protein [Acidobacteriota bacterium]